MYVFANESGQAIIVTGSVSKRMPFSFPALETSLTALVASVRVSPKPIVSVNSCLGGHNYINVFGEDPMHVEISGVVIGSSCNTTRQVSSVVSDTLSFYSSNGIINRVTPVTFRLSTSGAKLNRGFVVALTIQQSADNADLASFNMLLLTDSLDEREIVVSDPPSLTTTASTDQAARGVVSNIQASTLGAIPSQDWGSILIDSNGEVISRVTQTVQV